MKIHTVHQRVWIYWRGYLLAVLRRYVWADEKREHNRDHKRRRKQRPAPFRDPGFSESHRSHGQRMQRNSIVDSLPERASKQRECVAGALQLGAAFGTFSDVL